MQQVKNGLREDCHAAPLEYRGDKTFEAAGQERTATSIASSHAPREPRR